MSTVQQRDEFDNNDVYDDDAADDKFDADHAFYDADVHNDDGEDYADNLYPVQVLKNHLQLIYGPMVSDHIRTRFLGGGGGNLYVRASYSRIYWIYTVHSSAKKYDRQI